MTNVVQSKDPSEKHEFYIQRTLFKTDPPLSRSARPSQNQFQELRGETKPVDQTIQSMTPEGVTKPDCLFLCQVVTSIINRLGYFLSPSSFPPLVRSVTRETGVEEF